MIQLSLFPEPKTKFPTYVDPTAVRSPNPGSCAGGYTAKCAGWRNAGVTKINKLLILAYEPPAQGAQI